MFLMYPLAPHHIIILSPGITIIPIDFNFQWPGDDDDALETSNKCDQYVHFSGKITNLNARFNELTEI